MLAYLSKVRRPGNSGEASHRAKVSWTPVGGCGPGQRSTCQAKGPAAELHRFRLTPPGWSQLCRRARWLRRQRSLGSEAPSRVFQGGGRFPAASSAGKSRAPLQAVREAVQEAGNWFSPHLIAHSLPCGRMERCPRVKEETFPGPE